MKILTIVGARPQFIKAGTVSREIERRRALGSAIEEVLVHSGQHYDSNMSDVFFEEMKIPEPKYHLGVGGKSHGAMTGQMIEKMEEVLVAEKPDWVLVYGDTNSTLAGSIAASKLQIKIAHVEAGLRSFNMDMPEESNRILTDRISTLLFCPTEVAMSNLKNEGIAKWKTGAKSILVGDVMQDGALFYKDLAIKPNWIEENEKDFVLATIHRAENTNDPDRMREIIQALNEISNFKLVVLPLHPGTKSKLDSCSIELSNNIKVVDPVGYLNMVWLISNCSIVLTDSGGLQKEAFFFSKPCITMRDETEWVELVEANFNCLAGANANRIVSLFNDKAFERDYGINLYGNGSAAERIVTALLTCGK